MPSLPDLQRAFFGALFEDAGASANAPLLRLIRGDAPDAAERIAIYRNNLREGFAKALALEFPVIERLVGEDYFRQLAHELLACCPSRRGDLQHVGAPFPDLLARRFGASEYAYFADVARLEWCCQEVAIAPERPALAATELAALAARGESVALRLALHPAARLVESPYPIIAIWRSNQPAAEAETIDLGAGGERVLVQRGNRGILLRGLSQAEFRLASAIAAGLPLGEAVDAASLEPDFDLSRALQTLLVRGALTLLEEHST